VVYQDSLACLLGLEGIALLNAWAGDHERDFTDARLAEISPSTSTAGSPASRWMPPAGPAGSPNSARKRRNAS
jgi:hypothetical protein